MIAIPFTPRVIVRGDPINQYLEIAVKAKHTMIVRWDMVREEWAAHSDLFGIKTSPIGTGESPTEALENLIEKLTERERSIEP